MKTFLLLATCLILAGCGRQDENQREVMAKLEEIKSQLAGKHAEPVRWAFARKSEIDTAIFQWSNKKIEEAKNAEPLPPDVNEKIRQYEALQAELSQKRMDVMRHTHPPGPGAPGGPEAGTDIESLTYRVAAAKLPIADIVDRRNRQASGFRDQYSTDKLVAEYAKDRFDLVVDSGFGGFSSSTVLYRTNAEVLDITDGVIKLFREKTNQ
jgi:hypothetical protein